MAGNYMRERETTTKTKTKKKGGNVFFWPLPVWVALGTVYVRYAQYTIYVVA